MYVYLCVFVPVSVSVPQGDRVAYLCTKQAKVVAMTCTHAALKRREFLNLGLKYGADMSDVPMLLGMAKPATVLFSSSARAAGELDPSMMLSRVLCRQQGSYRLADMMAT